MAYNINTSSSAQFSPVTDFPAIGGWSFNVEPQINTYYIPGQTFPAAISIDTTIPDVITEFQDSTAFGSFIVEWDWENVTNSTNLWRALSTDIGSGLNNSEEITSTLDFNVTLTFQNLDWLSPNQNENYRFSGNVIFRIKGIRPNGSEQLLSERSINVNLYYVIQEMVALLPNHINFNHIAGNALPAGIDVDVYHAEEAVLWLTDSKFELSGAGTATQLGNSTTYYYVIPAPASGKTTVTVVPLIGIEDNQDQVINSTDALVAYVADDNSVASFQDELSISYFTSSDGSTSVTPQILSFTSIINVQESEPQNIHIFSPHNSSIEAPSWLLLSTTSVSGVGSVQVNPIAALNFAPGLYQGEITITNNGETFTITVLLQVVQNVNLNLSQDGFNFTDDNTAFTQIFTPESNTQLQIGVTIPQIGYPDTFAPDESFSYITGFLNNKTKIHIGEIVRRALYKITKADFEFLFNQYLNTIFLPLFSFEYYKPPQVKIELSEIDNTGTLQETQETFSNITFVLGRPPKVVDGFAFLNAKPVRQRVFKQSVAVINYLTSTPILLSIYQNEGLLVNVNQSFSGLKARGYFYDFKNFEIGDVIKFTASYLPFNANPIEEIQGLSETFIVFPDGKHFNTIAYADEYGCVRLFDFSGDWRIQSEYNFIESSKYENLVEFFRNEDTEKVQGITINTGFIPKDNEYYIDLIIRSGMAWLTTNGTEKVVELKPQTKTLTNVDSDQELYAYDLTFKINRTHDFQNYS